MLTDKPDDLPSKQNEATREEQMAPNVWMNADVVQQTKPYPWQETFEPDNTKGSPRKAEKRKFVDKLVNDEQNPTEDGPSLSKQPSLGQPSLGQPSLGLPSLGQPSLGQPSGPSDQPKRASSLHRTLRSYIQDQLPDPPPCITRSTSRPDPMAHFECLREQLTDPPPVGRASSVSSDVGSIDSQGKNFRYKTELCRNFKEKQQCVYGPGCQFAHGHRELREVVRNTKYKTKLCQKYWITGYCAYGPRCNFIHNESNDVRPDDSEEDQERLIGQVQSKIYQPPPPQPEPNKEEKSLVNALWARAQQLQYELEVEFGITQQEYNRTKERFDLGLESLDKRADYFGFFGDELRPSVTPFDLNNLDLDQFRRRQFEMKENVEKGPFKLMGDILSDGDNSYHSSSWEEMQSLSPISSDGMSNEK